VIFTKRFIDRHNVPRVWTGPFDLWFSKLIAAGEIHAYGLRRQVAFQTDRRNWIAEKILYRFPWGDGRRFAAVGLAGALLWLWLGSR
jgi:hypothetical protein